MPTSKELICSILTDMGYYCGMIIDLSVRLNEETPVYPGDPAVKIAPAGQLEKDGYCDHHISFGTHIGTHVDAPAHMLEGGKTLNQFPISQFMGTGKYVKVEGSFDLETIKNADINSGDIVLFHTDMSEKYHDSVYFEKYPVMSDEVARYLVECKVKMIGVDTGSVDILEDFPIHKILLAGDVLLIENLTNLKELSGKDFRVTALPLNVEIDGSPARVIAELL